MKLKSPRIESLESGQEVQGFFLVKEKRLSRTRAGDDYIDLILQDQTGTIPAKIWENVKALDDAFQEGEAVAVKGSTSVYKGRLQLSIEKITRVDERHAEYGYSPELVVPTSEQDPEELWRELQKIIEEMSEGPLRTLVEDIYQRFESTLKTLPAAVYIHHNVRGGFLEHVLSMARDALHYGAKFDDVNTDLLLAGVLLHDIGKLRELGGDLTPTYTDEGNFVGHIVLGHELILEHVRQISDFPEELRLHLEHLIISHQGKPEWQSPKRPQTREALILHAIDELDAKLNIFRKAVREDRSEGKWTSRNNYFASPLFKG